MIPLPERVSSARRAKSRAWAPPAALRRACRLRARRFVELIDKVYGDFTKKLLAQYPTLTKSDLQICCLTKQGFSNQVISILMNLQTNSYARRKSRIKQEKMNGLQDERSFEEIINSL